ncbi:hypothetical protein RB653_005694 [Dictyostelium firmibasis]|uniref:Uncharacterized protein n=1 Tax=Dictyostelium firmibasis TaxID=79012 RepID=A0AAN7U8E8_9MYCE
MRLLQDTTIKLTDNHLSASTNTKFNRLPPTTGGDVIITGGYLRYVGGPNTIICSFRGAFPEKGKVIIISMSPPVVGIAGNGFISGKKKIDQE